MCSWEGVHCCAPSDSPDWPDPTTTPTPTPTPTPTTTPTPTPTTTDSSIASADYPSSCSDPAQGVQALTLASNNVTGALSAVPWAALAASLQLLDLDSNQLTIGPPNSSSSSNSGGSSLTDAGLGALSQLAFLSAAGNALQGPLGDLGASLPRLGALVLPANQLTGTLPASLLTHPQLEYLGERVRGAWRAGPCAGATVVSDCLGTEMAEAMKTRDEGRGIGVEHCAFNLWDWSWESPGRAEGGQGPWLLGCGVGW